MGIFVDGEPDYNVEPGTGNPGTGNPGTGTGEPWKPVPYNPPALDEDKYVGVSVKQDASMVTLGQKSDIKIWRDGDGNMKIAAPRVDFISGAVTLNGNLLGAGGGDALQEMID